MGSGFGSGGTGLTRTLGWGFFLVLFFSAFLAFSAALAFSATLAALEALYAALYAALDTASASLDAAAKALAAAFFSFLDLRPYAFAETIASGLGLYVATKGGSRGVSKSRIIRLYADNLFTFCSYSNPKRIHYMSLFGFFKQLV
jgi:hypothetical protein